MSDGTGDAFPAEATTDETPDTPDVDHEAVAHAAQIDEARADVTNAQAKVARQQEHLAGAEQALAEAQARLAELGG